MRGFNDDAQAESALMCRMPGCRNRWSVNINHGRVCSHHDAALARSGGTAPPDGVKQRHQTPIPLREAVRPYAEPTEPDEEYFHDDRA